MDNARLVKAPDPRVHEYYEQKDLTAIAGALNVPVNDDDVRRELRLLSEPAELGKESREERRNRLVSILANKKRNELRAGETANSALSTESPKKSHVPAFFTDGSPDLVRQRELVAEYVSKYRAKANAGSHAGNSLNYFSQVELYASQSGFSRPISSVKFLSAGTAAVADWSGTIAIFGLDDSMPQLATQQTSCQISEVAAHENLIGCSLIDGSISVFSTDSDNTLTPVSKLVIPGDHQSRLNSIDFHPNGNIVVSASQDSNWQLWDWQRSTCLLKQPGHTGGVKTIRISNDGSLAVTGGMDNDARIWDLRSGVEVAVLRGHAREVECASWNPAIFDTTMELATGSADDRCLVWDLRNSSEPKKVIYAHNSTVSDMSYDPSGQVLITASLDGKIKFWNSQNEYRLLKTFETGSRIMSIDSHGLGDAFKLVAGRWDRLIDLYLE